MFSYQIEINIGQLTVQLILSQKIALQLRNMKQNSKAFFGLKYQNNEI